MTKTPKSETDHIAQARAQLVDAALMHAVFDGWCPATYRAALADSGVDPGLAKQAAPRGAIDLAVAFHKQADDKMRAIMADTDLSAMRYRDRVAFGDKRLHAEVIRGAC